MVLAYQSALAVVPAPSARRILHACRLVRAVGVAGERGRRSRWHQSWSPAGSGGRNDHREGHGQSQDQNGGELHLYSSIIVLLVAIEAMIGEGFDL